jgi:cytochrome c oxidase subunit III
MERTIQAVERKKIHPHKFVLYVAIGSIIMMFAGLTSAYIVQKAQGHWVYYKLPVIFYASTATILLSSFTIAFGVRAFKHRRMPQYKMLVTTTLILGVLFAVFQCIGFKQLYVDGNPSESFLFIITGFHLVHILGGIIALLIVFFRAYRTRIKIYNATGLEIVAAYWHFVDVLWIYLFVFFLANQ